MTNQASEDIVDSILSTLGIVDRKSGNRPGQIEVVKQIIRTEKLKLLAEVRERVVGEDENPESIPPTMSAEYHNYVHAQNILRDEQRYSLIKLEVENDRSEE